MTPSTAWGRSGGATEGGRKSDISCGQITKSQAACPQSASGRLLPFAHGQLCVVSSLSRMTVNDHSRSSRWPCKTSARILQQLNQPAHCLVDVSRGDDLDFKVIATELMASPACLLNDYLFITMGLAVWCTKSQRIFSGVGNINPEAFSN